jgi:O-antigen ligase
MRTVDAREPTIPVFGAVSLLRLEIWLLVLIPARLVVGPLGGAGSPATILGALLLLLWGVNVLDTRIGQLRPCRPLRLVLAAFWATSLASYAVMNWHPMPGDQSRNADRFLITAAAFSGIVLAAAEGLRNRRDFLAILRTAVNAVAVLALIGILQFRPGFDLTEYLERIPVLSVNGTLASIQTRGSFNRPAGTALHPIEFGVIVGTALAFAIHLALYDKSRKFWPRWLCVGLIALAVPVSISRSALLVAVCVLILFMTGASNALRVRSFAVLGIFSVFVFMTVPGLIGTLKGYVTAGSADSSISTRTSDYAAIAPYIRRSPWIGRGPGTFLPSIRILDNQYLLTLIEVGLFGFVALLALFGAPIALGAAARHWARNEPDRNLAQMFKAAGLATLVSAVTYDALSFPMFTLFTALWIGMAGGWWGIIRAEAAAAPQSLSQASRTSATGMATVHSSRGE